METQAVSGSGFVVANSGLESTSVDTDRAQEACRISVIPALARIVAARSRAFMGVRTTGGRCKTRAYSLRPMVWHVRGPPARVLTV